jgi:hypothetical protein
MRDWRNLSQEEQTRIDEQIVKEITQKRHLHEPTGFVWYEPYWTIQNVHMGHYCADCWRTEYGCLCKNDEDELC